MDETERDARPPRGRRLLIRLGLLIGIPVASFLALEVAATLRVGAGFVRGRHLGNDWRIVGRLDPDYGWANAPGASGHITDGQIDYSARINSSGFRDPERRLEKAPGTQRVLLLGDSVTWGWGVNDGQRFSDLLEARLGEDVEVLNLAVPGYGTDQQYWTLTERGFAYDPDVVLVCLILNDVFEAEENERYGMRKPRYLRAADGAWRIEGRPVVFEDSALQRWWRAQVRELQVQSAFVALLTGAQTEPVSPTAAAETVYRRPKAAQLAPVAEAAGRISDPSSATYHLLGLMRDACAERGVQLLLTSIAHKHDQYLYEPRFPLPLGELGSDFRTVVTEHVVAGGERLGIPTIELDAAMLAETSAGVRLHCGDGHLNAEGNRVVADALEPALRAALERARGH